MLVEIQDNLWKIQAAMESSKGESETEHQANLAALRLLGLFLDDLHKMTDALQILAMNDSARLIKEKER